MVDEKTFFHEATIRICGQLEIGQAMKDCLKYIQDYLPAETMYCELMEPEQGGMRFIAVATADEGRVPFFSWEHRLQNDGIFRWAI